MSLSCEGEKSSRPLTSRQKDIIEAITKASGAITVSSIAARLGVSSRTALRELPAIEKWFSKNGFKLSKKTGVGITLMESFENRNEILRLLSNEKISKDYSREERRRLIMGELLETGEPLKSGYFTKKYRISEGTLSADLDAISKRLLADGLTLERRQGVGISLSGNETAFRRAIADAIYDCLDESEIFKLIKGERERLTPLNAENRLIGLIDKETTSAVESVMRDVENRLRIKYSDSAYMALLAHITLAVKRILNSEKISMEKSKLERLERLPEFSVAQEICVGLEGAFGITIPAEETGYITMHLSSAKIWPHKKQPELDDINAKTLANTIISEMERLLDTSFADNRQLADDIEAHLLPTLSRIKFGISIKNSQLNTIKTKYKDVFDKTAIALSPLCKICGAQEISQDEISFIAMHFCAAIETKRADETKRIAAVVCPTGVGSSRLLAANLIKEFPNIEIKEIISALKIDENYLEKSGVDIIISTVALDVDFNNVCVNPALTSYDKKLITQALKTKAKAKKASPPSPKTFFGKNEIIHIIKRGEEILNVLDNFKYLNVKTAETISDVISEGAKLLADAKEDIPVIEAGLLNREKIGQTYIDELRIMLLHCKTPVKKHCSLGYISISDGFKTANGTANGAIVMLIPESENPVFAEVMGAVSEALMENKRIALGLRTRSQRLALGELERSLGKYFKDGVSL